MLASAIVDLEAAQASVESNGGHSVSGMHALSAKSDDSDLELELEHGPWRRDPSTGSWRPAEKPAEGNTTQKRSRGANWRLDAVLQLRRQTLLFSSGGLTSRLYADPSHPYSYARPGSDLDKVRPTVSHSLPLM